MQRRPDWQSRLCEFVRANETRPFVWGEWDCALWTAAAIEAITGTDIAVDIRGKYSTEDEAHAIFASFTDTAAQIAAQFGMKEVSPMHAQRGDLIATSVCLGLVGLDSQVLVLGDSGLTKVEYRHIQRAWRVG